VRTVRELRVTPHVTKSDKGRSSNLDRRTTRQPGYAVSLSRRWLMKKLRMAEGKPGRVRQVKLRGLEKWIGCSSFSLRRDNLRAASETDGPATGKAARSSCAETVVAGICISLRYPQPDEH